MCCFAYVHGLLSGDVVCLEAFGQVVVILSSLTAIKDLVEKRGELYADRTPFPIFEMFALPCFFYLNLSLANGAIHLSQNGHGVDVPAHQKGKVLARRQKIARTQFPPWRNGLAWASD
jgi:hypothetical protein